MNIVDLKNAVKQKDYNSFKTLLTNVLKSTIDNETEVFLFLYLACYDLGFISIGQKLLELGFERFDKPEYQDLSRKLLSNAAFYTNPIYARPSYTLTQVSFKKQFVSHNPFIVRDPVTSDYIVGVRVINLKYNNGSDYDIFIIGNDGMIKNIFPLVYEFNYKKYNLLVNFHGVEDIRCINSPLLKDKFLAIGTTMNTHVEGTTKMSMFHLIPTRNANGTLIKLTASHILPLRGYRDNRKQKNWLPICQQQNIFFIYSHSPFIVLKARRDEFTHNFTGDVDVYINKDYPKLKGLRGSTSPIPYKNKQNKNNYLYLVHYTESKNKVYYHRFIEMSLDFQILRMSALFYFERNHTVEYAVSMIPKDTRPLLTTDFPENVESYYISYGIQDKLARITEVSKQGIEDLFDLRESLIT